MARVMAVSFTTYGRLYYLDPGAVTYAIGDRVLHPTEAGPEVATVVWAPEQVDSEKLTGLPLCPGPAIEADLARDAANRRRVAEIEGVVRGLVERHQLAMKVVGVDLDDRSPEFGTLVAVYYTAPHRVDFRALLSDLARSLRSRIDLRQIGARDAARISGGLGSCGRELCCATFLTDFEPVSVRLARAQDLPANPLQIAGACGRLMCCLKYEHPLYVDFAARAPAVGAAVTTPDGDGVVVGHNVPSQSVLVKGSGGEVVRCPLLSVCERRRSRDGL